MGVGGRGAMTIAAQTAAQTLKNLNTWRPPGPKANGWYKSQAPMSFIMGPVGGGKTWTGGMKCLDVARLQHPSTTDGIRKALVVAVRMNYRRAHDTLLPSWKKLFPETVPGVEKWRYSEVKGGPVDHDIFIEDEKYGKILLQWRLRAFGDQDLDSFIRGFEPTAFWLNETDEMPANSLGDFFQRCGRAFNDERPRDVAPAYHGVFGDFNAPDEDSWLYEDLWLKRMKGVELYIQPGGLDANAENIHNLPGGKKFYEIRAGLYPDWKKLRMIDNKIGMSRLGKPVYPQFKDHFHVDQGEEMGPVRGAPLIVPADPGRRCAGAVMQLNPADMCLSVLREAVSPEGEAWDAKMLAERLAQILTGENGLFEPYLNERGIMFSIDPNYFPKGTGIDAEVTWTQRFHETMMREIGICPLRPPHTNHIDDRLAAVRRFLASPDGEPRFRVWHRNHYTRRAFNGGYHLEKTIGANGGYKVEPTKKFYSNIANTIEMGAVVAAGPIGKVMGSARRETRKPHRPRKQAPLVGAVI